MVAPWTADKSYAPDRYPVSFFATSPASGSRYGTIWISGEIFVMGAMNGLTAPSSPQRVPPNMYVFRVKLNVAVCISSESLLCSVYDSIYMSFPITTYEEYFTLRYFGCLDETYTSVLKNGTICPIIISRSVINLETRTTE